MNFDHILVHYGEIALKGKNRKYFESRLVQNIKSQLEAFAPGSFENASNIFGGILIKLNKKGLKNKADGIGPKRIHFLGLETQDIATVYDDLTLLRPIKPAHRVHQRRLAAAALTDDRDAFTCRNRKTYIIECRKKIILLAVRLGDIFYFNHAIHPSIA